MADSTALAPTSTGQPGTAPATTTTAPAATGAGTSNRKTALADAFRTHFSGDAPLTEKARNFARARPWTSAAFLGIAAVAVLNSLRGRR
jgi:hypothetical protein